MKDCIHTIGLINTDFDCPQFLRIDDLSPLKNTYRDDLDDLLNGYKVFGRALKKFNYCPYCGAKIDWNKIEAYLITNKK